MSICMWMHWLWSGCWQSYVALYIAAFFALSTYRSYYTRVNCLPFLLRVLRKPNHGKGIVSTKKAQAEECLWFSWFIILFHCFMMYLSCLRPCVIYFILLWHDSPFVLKVPLDTNQLTNTKSCCEYLLAAVVNVLRPPVDDDAACRGYGVVACLYSRSVSQLANQPELPSALLTFFPSFDNVCPVLIVLEFHAPSGVELTSCRHPVYSWDTDIKKLLKSYLFFS